MGLENSKRDLLKALSDGDSTKKRHAIIALKDYPEHETITQLEKLYNDPDAAIRYFAKKAVKEIREFLEASPVSELIESNPLPAVNKVIPQNVNTTQLESDQSVSEKKSERFPDDLLPNIESTSLKNLGITTTQSVSNTTNMISVPSEHHSFFEPVRPTPIELDEILKSGNIDAKIKAIDNISSVPDNSFLPVIIENISAETNEKVIASLVKLIGMLGGEEQIKNIVKYLSFNDIRVKANAIEALGLIGTVKIIPFIAPFLNDDDNRIKANAISAISKFQPDEMLKILSKMVKSDKLWMRDSAVFVLGGIENEASVELLNESLNDENKNVSEHAYTVLSKINLPLAKKYVKTFDEKNKSKNEVLEFDCDEIDSMFQKDSVPVDEELPAIKEIKINSESLEIKNLSKQTHTESVQSVNNTSPTILNTSSGSKENSTGELKECLRCGKKNGADRKTCGKCGYKFPATKSIEIEAAAEIQNCPECGFELSCGLHNCPECGYELRNNQEVTELAMNALDKPENFLMVSDFKENNMEAIPKNCPECGMELTDNIEKCPECGFTFVESEKTVAKNEICPECGTYRSGNNNVCNECGYEFIGALDMQQVDAICKSIICPECNETINYGSNVCGNCGWELIVLSNDVEKKCPECNQLVTTGNVCGNCGFEFENILANNSQNLSNASILNENEKECPFCAEIIKKAAKICKYCHSKLEM